MLLVVTVVSNAESASEGRECCPSVVQAVLWDEGTHLGALSSSSMWDFGAGAQPSTCGPAACASLRRWSHSPDPYLWLNTSPASSLSPPGSGWGAGYLLFQAGIPWMCGFAAGNIGAVSVGMTGSTEGL